jgi:hypothetical protein
MDVFAPNQCADGHLVLLSGGILLMPVEDDAGSALSNM